MQVEEMGFWAHKAAYVMELWTVVCLPPPNILLSLKLFLHINIALLKISNKIPGTELQEGTVNVITASCL